jgi:SepF-like predicted cell division protein (DUF552 family)
MSIFSNFFRKKPDVSADSKIDEFTEIPIEVDQAEKIKVMIDRLDTLSDADRVIKKVRSGNVVIARIKDMKENNLDELKHSISKIKTSCTVFQGDLAGVGDEWLLITPSTVRINRE